MNCKYIEVMKDMYTRTVIDVRTIGGEKNAFLNMLSLHQRLKAKCLPICLSHGTNYYWMKSFKSMKFRKRVSFRQRHG